MEACDIVTGIKAADANENIHKAEANLIAQFHSKAQHDSIVQANLVAKIEEAKKEAVETKYELSKEVSNAKFELMKEQANGFKQIEILIRSQKEQDLRDENLRLKLEATCTPVV